MRHEWAIVSTLKEKADHGFHPLANIRKCLNCGAYQERVPTYNGEYGRNGPKVTGRIFIPRVGRCQLGD